MNYKDEIIDIIIEDINNIKNRPDYLLKKEKYDILINNNKCYIAYMNNLPDQELNSTMEVVK